MKYSDIDRDFHNIIGRDYDSVVVDPRRLANSFIFDVMRPLLPEQRENMLDLGCGTGQATLAFADTFANCVLVDHSASMLAAASANLSKRIGASGGSLVKYKFIESDFQGYFSGPYVHNHFDAVFCVGFFHHIAPSDRVALLRSITRVMAPGSRLFVADPVYTDATEPKLLSHWNAKFRSSFTVPWAGVTEPQEAPLYLADFLFEAESVGLVPIFKRRYFEIFPRFDSWLDFLPTWFFSQFGRSSALIFSGVFKKK